MGIGKVSGADVSIVKKVSGTTSFLTISTGSPVEIGTHVFLLVGQSNMVGRPTFDGGTGYPSGTLQYPKATGYPTYTDTTTISASPPLGHWDAQAGDMGLALQFTIDYVNETGNTVVLIPAAAGGTSFLQNEWNPGDVYYEHAVDATNALMTANPSWLFKAILWHQGESDKVSSEAVYSTALFKMIQQMRVDITEANQETPFITGELLVGGSGTTANNTAVITNTPVYNYQTALVSSASLTSDDNLHFHAASLRIFGTRYKNAFTGLNNPYPSAESGSVGHWIFGRSNQLYIDLTGIATNLTENSAAPSFAYNYAEIVNQNDGLATSIGEPSTFTMCFVVNTQSQNAILGGTLTQSGAGSDGVSLYISGSTNLIFNERGGTGSVTIGSMTSSFYFIALSIDSSDNYVGYIGDQTTTTVVTGTGPGRNASTRALGIGDTHYNSASFNGSPQFAEAIFFDSAKTESELDAIYTRSVARMSARNITVQ